MKALLIILLFCSFGTIAQTLNPHYLKDTFELDESYLFEHAYGWFTEDTDGISIHFSAAEKPKVNGKYHFELYEWLPSGKYSAPVNVVNDSTFSFIIKWVDSSGIELTCNYTGTLTTRYLKKIVRFQTDCTSDNQFGNLKMMKGSDAWPGFLPSSFGLVSGIVVETDCYNMDINEPSLVLNILNDNGDTLYCDVFYDYGLRKMSNDKHSYFMNKKVQLVHFVPHDGRKYYSGWKIIVEEGKE